MYCTTNISFVFNVDTSRSVQYCYYSIMRLIKSSGQCVIVFNVHPVFCILLRMLYCKICVWNSALCVHWFQLCFFLLVQGYWEKLQNVFALFECRQPFFFKFCHQCLATAEIVKTHSLNIFLKCLPQIYKLGLVTIKIILIVNFLKNLRLINS